MQAQAQAQKDADVAKKAAQDKKDAETAQLAVLAQVNADAAKLAAKAAADAQAALEEQKRIEAAKKIANEQISKQEAANKNSEPKNDIKEKDNLAVEINRIRVTFDCGFGNALYITGQDPSLGNWNFGYKLTSIKSNEWLYQSGSLKDGMEYKIVIYKWIEEDSFSIAEVKKQNANLIKWENDKQGAAGNKITYFKENEMKHTPLFVRRK